jgi:8-oxo-dGDP phosphatase
MGESAWFDTRDSRVVHEGFSTVRIETVATPDGSVVEREVVVHTDAVAIVPMTDTGEVLLLRHYRQPVRQYLLEVPAGKMDVPGEDPEGTAQRELQEEIHHRAENLRHLTTFHNSAGWTTERTHVFLATGLSDAPPPADFSPDAEESDMEVVALPFDVAVERVRRGELTDAKTAIGLLLAERHLG